MRIYGNDLPGHRDVSIDGGHLLKVVDRVVNRKHSRLVLDVSNGRVEWRARRSRRQFIESMFLFSLEPGSAAGLYVGLNRVVAGDFRAGSGLCGVLVSLFADRGQSPSLSLSLCLSLRLHIQGGPKKTAHGFLCNNFAYSQPIFIIFGLCKPQEICNWKVYS